MAPNNEHDEHFVEGAHGTIAEQENEDFYDERSDAEDDVEKGRIRFPTNVLYGRERELELLHAIYGELASSFGGGETRRLRRKEVSFKGEEKEEATLEGGFDEASSDPFDRFRVVFLSGYSGIGKSALVREFVKQLQSKYRSPDNNSQILYVYGKYTLKVTASAPFSAIAEMLEKLTNTIVKGGENENGHKMCSKVMRKIRESELIGPEKQGSLVLHSTFTALAPLLGSLIWTKEKRKTVRLSMGAIKECTCEILSIICEALDYPMVLHLDDLQWGDDASIALLTYLLSSKKLKNLIFFCAYRSNKLDANHSFTKLMENVKAARKCIGYETCPKSVTKMDLFSLSLDLITKFVADSVKKNENEGVAELAEAIYIKTMGNIFFVMQALEELVRKNILFYDMMCFEWRWVVSRVELGNYLSDDVKESVKGKIKELPADIKRLLLVMAYIPNTLEVPMLTALMNHGEFSSFDESRVRKLLKDASDEGMLLLSIERKNYVFAHDRIRQASLEVAAETEDNLNELLLHMSTVTLDFARGRESEWCLYVAVDLLNSLPFDESTAIDVIKLNMRVAKVARSRGSIGKENELLHKALGCLRIPGVAWIEYTLILQLYNSIIVSEYCLGHFDKARLAIAAILKNAKSMNDKMEAYVYMILCKCDETSDYNQAVEDGCKILNLYDFDITTAPTAAYIAKESTKLNMALRARSISCLLDLPMNDNPFFWLISIVQKYARWTSNHKLAKILAWKGIRCAIKRGMDRRLPIILVTHATILADQGKMKTALEMYNVSFDLAEKIHDDKENYAFTRMLAYGCILCREQSFRSLVEPIFQCHKDLKLVSGNAEAILGSMTMYFESWFAAGLELGLNIESKLRLVEELSENLERSSFLATFQTFRQFVLNLRTRTANPTELQGEAFREGEVLNKMNSKARCMTVRDSSSWRLQLAFIFWDEAVMAQMLNVLADHPLKDTSVARLHNRLCFIGLAAFGLRKKKGCESFSKIGKNCLNHFESLMRLGSSNATPVYSFLIAMKGPSRETFNAAILACAHAGMTHLEAMAKEQYALFLYTEKDVLLANDYITSSYLLYQDWGAHAKASQLLQKHDFLKNTKRPAPRRPMHGKSLAKIGKSNSAYSFNRSFKMVKRMSTRRLSSTA